jgi:uncharacterized protein YjbI with pentapeptide repeats
VLFRSDLIFAKNCGTLLIKCKSELLIIKSYFWWGKLIFSSSIFVRVSFFNTNFTGADFAESTMRSCDVINSNLTENIRLLNPMMDTRPNFCLIFFYKRFEFNSQQQFLQPIEVQPVTKYIKNGTTIIHPFYNINGYSYKLSDNKLGMITSNTPTLNQRDGSSKTQGKKLLFTPNSEEISKRSNEQATIVVYPTTVTDLVMQPVTIDLFFNIGN